MDTAGKSIGDRRPLLYLRLLTRRVNDQLGQICSHSSLIRRFGHSAQPPTAGFRMKASPAGTLVILLGLKLDLLPNLFAARPTFACSRGLGVLLDAGTK